MSSALVHLLEAHGWESDDAAAVSERLIRYADLLTHHNRRMNLMGRLDRDQIIDDLVIDALLPALVCAPITPLLDIGSGAGIPGVPLAMLCPDVNVHLIEPRQKRITFLIIAMRRLALENVLVRRHRIEEIEEPVPGTVGTMAAKAFQPPKQWLETASGWVRPGGLIYMYASSTSWPDRAEDYIAGLGIEEVGRKNHPNREDRFAVVFRRLPEEPS